MQIAKNTKIGHVHLAVSNLKKSEDFYTQILGFEVTSRLGDSAVFLSAGGYHHHIGLNTWETLGSTPPPFGHTGLFHFAILLPNRKELAKVVKNIIDKNYPFEGFADHDVSEAIYLRDPDNIGIELYCDRPESQWKKENGNIKMDTKQLDIQSLMSELDK